MEGPKIKNLPKTFQ